MATRGDWSSKSMLENETWWKQEARPFDFEHKQT